MGSINKQVNEKDLFIWTEAYNCGVLLKPFLTSFFKHNSFHVNVFCSENDLTPELTEFDNVTFHTSNSNPGAYFKLENAILDGYRKGHKGTATLWTNLIKIRQEKYLLHLDADTIFLEEVITDLVEKLISNNASIVGTRRPYLHRNYRLKGLDSYLLNLRPDTINTDYFIFNRECIAKINKNLLQAMIVGRRIGLLPVVDFFDPVTFRLSKFKNGIFYIDSPEKGSQAKPNTHSQSFLNRISFSAVGSGVNFWKNPEIQIPAGYKEYALRSFSLYSKYILGVDIEYPILDDPGLIENLERLDLQDWKLVT